MKNWDRLVLGPGGDVQEGEGKLEDDINHKISLQMEDVPLFAMERTPRCIVGNEKSTR